MLNFSFLFLLTLIRFVTSNVLKKVTIGLGAFIQSSYAKDGKVSLIAMATDGAVKKGAHAGNLIKGIAGLVGGGGGGRPNMAQAGGKKPDGIDAALAEAKTVLESQIG